MSRKSKNACLRKCAYVEKGIAEEVAKKRFRRTGLKLYVYFCRECGHHHLTRFPRKA